MNFANKLGNVAPNTASAQISDYFNTFEIMCVI